MLENFGMKIRNVGKSAQKMTESFNINTQIEDKNKELKECYRQLGEMFYKQNKESVPDQYRGIFDKIEYLNQSVEQLHNQLQQVKGIRMCPQCGGMVEVNSNFCMKCGYSMPFKPLQAENVKKKICYRCGMTNNEDAVFCIGCGIDLNLQNYYENKVFRTEEYPDRMEESESNGYKNICKICGADIKEGNQFCIKCGTRVE